jgi:hypothetical protein
MLSILALAVLIQEPAKAPAVSPMFGSFVLGVGDVDGDKVPDFLIGDEGWTPSASPAAFWVLSGKDAHEILAFHAESAGTEFPSHVIPAGDADKDGHADLWLVLAPKSGSTERRVVLWSAKSKALTRDATRDERVPVLSLADGQRPLGDFNGDGVADELRGKSILSGKDNSVLWSGDTAEEVLLFDDVDHDGARDLLCAFPNSAVAQGNVVLVSSRSGNQIWNVGGNGASYFGAAIDVVGDLDGDGVNEWIVGNDNLESHDPGLPQIRSGKTGALLATLRRRGSDVLSFGPLFTK